MRSLRFCGITLALLGSLSLAGCDSLLGTHPAKTVKPKSAKLKKPEEKVAASSYIENLTIARMELSRNPANMSPVSPRLNVVRNYMAQTKAKAEQVRIAVFDYSLKGKDGDMQAVAPFSMAQRSFPALGHVLSAMEVTPYTLKNIRVLTTEVMPDAATALPEEPLMLANALDAQQRHLLSQSGRCAAGDEIMTQIALLEYFTDHRQQDAAYLTVENVKHLLAKATQDKTLDEESLTTLSGKINGMESQLKQKMPYTF